MEKLKLEDIVGYLPYGLKWVRRDNNYIEFVMGGLLNETVISTNGNSYEMNGKDKPVLHPLSDLAKKIDINDSEYIIPISSIFHDWRKSLEIKFNYVNGEMVEMWLDYPESNGDYVMESSMTLKDWQRLFELHFDVFGLIEKDLAIDINTIK